MGYRLGLDVGTASCGLVAWTLDNKDRPEKLAYHSLDVWQEPLLPAKSGGVGEPKKAARRAARQVRRLTGRRSRRLRRIAHLAELLGISSNGASSSESKRRRLKIEGRKGADVYRLRAMAVERRVDLDDLLRVLMHLAKRRGPSGDWVYAGSTKTSSDPKSRVPQSLDDADKQAARERKDIAGGVRKLEELIDRAAKALHKNSLTLGQYLNYRREHQESVIIGRSNIGLYPSRRMVEDEFNAIWDTQSEYHPVLRRQNVRKEFFDAIFFQRPLKSPAPMVGRCSLEPTLPRAPAAQMAAQTFRIEKQLADLRWGMGRRAQPLSSEQKAVIRELLNTQSKATFNSISSALSKAGCPGPSGQGLNMDRFSREELKGNTTLAAFRKLGLEAAWAELDQKTQVQVINFLADIGSPDVLDSEDWHLNFAVEHKDKTTGQKQRKQKTFSRALVSFINQMRERPGFGRLSSMGFDGKRMSYSIKALRKLGALMREGYDEHDAIEQAYPGRFKHKALHDGLQPPVETGNTVVDVALRQVHRAIVRAMDKMGEPPAQVIVELSRDLALGLRKRGEIESRINANGRRRKQAAEAIREEGQQVTDRTIQRYLLWEQQLHYCPYCSRRISLGEALGSETEREHILPRTLTRVGGKRSQIVLAHKSCNNEKGNRTPWQAFGSDEHRWRIIEERAKQLSGNKQWSKARLLLLKDWEDEILDSKAIRSFTDRQFHESSWIAKLTAQWLRGICRDVWVARGALTAHLRRIWKLETVIPEVRSMAGLPVLDREGAVITDEDFQNHKLWWEGHSQSSGGMPTDRKPDKRIDQRHHLLDALVISLSDRSLFMEMAENYKRESEKARHGEYAKLTRFAEPPVAGLRKLALDLIANARIRHKPDRYPDGPLFKATAYGVSRKPDDNGNYRLASSKLLEDLIDGKSDKKTRKRLNDIESPVTRAAVLEEFDRRIAAKIPLKKVFEEAILHPQFGTPIRRVRLLDDSIEIAAEINHKNRYGKILKKYYPHAGYAYLELTIDEGRLIGEPRLVPVQEAVLTKGRRPAMNHVYKGDVIADVREGKEYRIKQLKNKTGKTPIRLVAVPATETLGVAALEKLRMKMVRKIPATDLINFKPVNV